MDNTMKIFISRYLIIVSFFCVSIILILYWVFDSRLIVIKHGQPIDNVLISQKYQDGFEESLARTENFFNPFHKAAQLMENGKYNAALDALNESLKVASRPIEKTMIYRMMQMIYNKQDNLQGELQAINSWFEVADPSASNPEFKHRAEEIRQILAKQQK